MVAKNEDVRIFENALDAIDTELEAIQREKLFISGEDKIRELIRNKIKDRMG